MYVYGQNFTQESTTNSERSDAETVVTTKTGLEAAFDDLSAGDTIRISDENAPYRTTQWLDVDGNYVGAEVTVGREGASIDVFVRDG